MSEIKKTKQKENGRRTAGQNDPITDYFHPFPHFATMAIHAGQDPKQWNCRAVVPLISLSTTFQQDFPGELSSEGFDYIRSGNPTRKVTETCVAALDAAKYCLLFSSGLGATMNLFNLLKAGDHIVCMDDVYGGTNRLLSKVLINMNLSTSFVDLTNPLNVQKAIKPNTKVVWIETPTNPTLKIVDIRVVRDLVKEVNEEILVVVDNTFMSSYFQRPLDLGADVCFQSLTKYMNGHSDVLMGSISTNNDDLYNKLFFLQYSIGAVPSPFDCYLANRGLKTLAVRMRTHFESGMVVARYLEKNPRVEKVIHPGLTSHPHHEIAKKQMRGFSGMLSFYIRGGLQQSRIFLSTTKLFTLAESLGGYESLAELPSIMTHASVPEKDRELLGIKDNLIRLSIGLEEVEDLIEDIEQALVAAIPDLKKM